MYENNSVTFKGNRDGISIYLNKNLNFENLKDALIKKLESAKLFFEGAKVIGIQGKKLTEEQISEIKEIIQSKYGMKIIEKVNEKIEKSNTENFFEGINEGNTKFIRSTIRSGQKICFSGNIVVIGDVNPGAEVIAEGNILVMGILRGLAHAGTSGNTKAFVAAFSLQATQLRIANIIGRSPDCDLIKPISPEIAMVKNEILVIEPYLPKK